MAKKKENQFKLGPILTLLIVLVSITILSTIFSHLGLTTNKSEIINGEIVNTSIEVKNIISKDGIQYLLANIVSNFQNFNAIYLFIIAMLGIGFADSSGLFQKALKNARKYKLSFIIILTLIIGSLVGSSGTNIYAFMLPLAGYVYKNLNKNPLIGIITMFLALTMGEAASLIPNYLNQNLGVTTELAAKMTVDANYAFKTSSLIFILVSSLIIFVIFGKLIIDKYLIQKIPKLKSEEVEELEVNNNGLKNTSSALLIMFFLLLYAILPNLPLSGWLLKDGTNYLERLLGVGAPFRESCVLIFSLICVIAGTVYGISAKKIKSFDDFTRGFSHSFSGMSLVFALAFLTSQLITLVEYTGIDVFITSALINWISTLEITGLGLISIYFIILIIVTVIMPNTFNKWQIIAPVAVPLLMRANISASFTQFIFTAADGIGKSVSIFFPYTAILFGLIYKYTDSGNYGFFRVYKLLSPLLILFTIVWLIIIITWYVVGIPLGVGVLPSL